MRCFAIPTVLVMLLSAASCTQRDTSRTRSVAQNGRTPSAAPEPGDPSASDPDDSLIDSRIEAILTELRALPRRKGGFFWCWHYDWHGNANESLQQLMKMRFAATRRICQELDAADRAEFPTYVWTLYHVLGFVKDPASIAWLDADLGHDRETDLYESYMPHWRTFLRGAGHDYVKWVEDPARWSAFFQRLYGRENDPERRFTILYAMQEWLHDPSTLAFFTRQEQSSETRGEELLIAQLYLHQHARDFDVERLKRTIDELKSAEEAASLLLSFADQIRHEAFVPGLISVAGPKTNEAHVGSVQWVLEEISFRRDVSGREEWTAWYARHGHETRQEWIEGAVREFLELIDARPLEAKAFLDKAMYRWKDIMLLPHMEELLKHKIIHDELVGWINLTYRPHWRQSLHAVAKRIIEESGDDLAGWAVGLLRGLDFLEGRTTTWKGHVRADNSKL